MKINLDEINNPVRMTIDKIMIERRKREHDFVMAEIQEIATEHGIDRKIIIDEDAVVNAFEKQTPKKPKLDENEWTCCPNCHDAFKIRDIFKHRNNYCGNCGQKLDWSETEKGGGSDAG